MYDIRPERCIVTIALLDQWLKIIVTNGWLNEKPLKNIVTNGWLNEKPLKNIVTNGWLNEKPLKNIVTNGWLNEKPLKNHWSQWLSRYHSINGNGHLKKTLIFGDGSKLSAFMSS